MEIRMTFFWCAHFLNPGFFNVARTQTDQVKIIQSIVLHILQLNHHSGSAGTPLIVLLALFTFKYKSINWQF